MEAQTSHRSVLLRIIQSTPLKTAGVIVFTVITWHYSETAAIAKVEAETVANYAQLSQHNGDQDKRMDVLRESTQRKVEKETYDRDIRDLREGQQRLQASVDQILNLLIEKR